MTNNYIEKNWFSENTNKRGRILGKKKIFPPRTGREKTGTHFAPAQASSSAVRSLQGSSHPSPLGSSQCFLVVYPHLASSLHHSPSFFKNGEKELWKEALSFCLCCVLWRSYCFHLESWEFLERYVHAYAHAFTCTCLLQEGLWFRRTHMYVIYVCCLQAWHRVKGNLEELVLI